MLFLIRKKIYSMLKINKKNKFKYECIKICLIYSVIGILWVYFSDRIANKIASNNSMFLIISTYKGWIYVIVTSIILYLLIGNLLKKVDLTEKKLNESYKELSSVNEELEAYVQQLTASEEELRVQYDQIIENEKNLRKSEEKYKTLVNEMHQGLALYEVVLNEEGEAINYSFLDGNESHEKLVKLKNKDILGKTILEIFPSTGNEIIKLLRDVIKTGKPICYENYLQELDKHMEVVAYRPKPLQLAAIVTDISGRKQMEYELQYLSYHDQLTGLYNRRFFEEELRRIDEERNLPLSVIMADVNGLKLVNDSFGHTVGDELLKKVVEVIIRGCRKEDIIARLAGDEFVILLPKTSIYETEEVVKNIKALALKEKVGSVDISISLGYETKIDKEEKILDILKKAEDHMYKKKLFESPSMRGKTINAIITTLHEKNKREEAHSYRVSKLCESMGKALGLSEDDIKELKTVGLLHDIGKIAIEENILNKKEKLTEEEWEEIKRHPEIGYRILSTVNDMSEMSEYVLAHHERWDGIGYPKGLKGEEIPLQSRIITIADSYDAMISERSYRDALPEEVAIKELKTNEGIQFDPSLIRLFIEKVLNKPFD